MCGIAGLFHFDRQLCDEFVLKKMTDRMWHRGPDDEGFLVDECFGMGMRRLSIIDVRGGKQPVSSENGRYHVVLNGEIYNYLELRAQLIQKGYQFKTKSDTEVIAQLFQDKGSACIGDLNGMFVFAVWDRDERVLYLFRDRLGIKPLFYTQIGRSFAFCSDVQALLTYTGKQEVAFSSFLFYLGLAYVPYPHSIYEHIQKLPPATFLKVKADGMVESRCYWKIEREQTLRLARASDYRDLILAALEDAVTLQLRSDVPIGTFLSAGFDSSAVVAMLSKKTADPVRTFSIGFEHGFNELPHAKKISEHFGTEHYEATLLNEDLLPILTEAVHYLDEPIYDNTILPTYFLSREAGDRGVKVILNGTGGDELFAGYTRYQVNTVRKLLLRIPPYLRKSLSKVTRLFSHDKTQKMIHPVLMFLASGIDFDFMHNVFLDKTGQVDRIRLLADTFSLSSRSNLTLTDLMMGDLQGYLVDDILAVLDKMTMAHSIEGRVPLLDHRLVELAYSIPDDKKLLGGELKGLFKYCLRDTLPGFMFGLPKRGLSGPTAHWVNGPLREDILFHIVKSPIDFFIKHLDLAWIEKIVKMSEIPSNFCESIFGLYVFSLWYKNHVLGHAPSITRSAHCLA